MGTCMHTHVRRIHMPHICMHMHAYNLICRYTCLDMCTYTCTHTCIHTCTNTMHAHLCTTDTHIHVRVAIICWLSDWGIYILYALVFYLNVCLWNSVRSWSWQLSCCEGSGNWTLVLWKNSQSLNCWAIAQAPWDHLLAHSFQQLLRSINLPPFCAVEPGAGFWALGQQTVSHLVCSELRTPQGEN